MRIQVFAVVLFGLCMWGVVFMRLQGGFVDVKVNRPKVVKGNEPKVVKGNKPKVAKGNEPNVAKGNEPNVAKGNEPNVAKGVNVVKGNKPTLLLHGVNSGYGKVYELLHSVQRDICSDVHVLEGDNNKEPDVHICLDNISPPCVVYSIGIANNWIFDDFMISQGCHVYSFDPSMNAVKHKRHKNHLFEPIGIGSVSGIHEGPTTLINGQTNYNVLTLGDMMKRHNHTHIDIIRIDVEYAEWDVLKQWQISNTFSNIDQLLIEIHMWKKPVHSHHAEFHSNILDSIPMKLFHKARNKWNHKRLYDNMTQVYELGFIVPKKQHTAPKRWKAGNDIKYDTVAKIIRAFDDAEIDSFIMAGAALGAHRHHGWMPWDKDSDILVMSTNKAKIDNILRANNISFKHQTDGRGPGRDGFGYHINIPRSEKYIDLWLFEAISDNEIQCKGINGGCKRWCNKYTASPMCKPLVKEWFYPVQLVPYGNYLMPCGREAYLDFYYSRSWRTKCRGWVHGKQRCVDFYNTTDFVFQGVDENGYKMEILKQDSKIKHIFSIINGTYTLKSLL